MSQDNTGGPDPQQPHPRWLVPADDEGVEVPEVPRSRSRHAAPDPEPDPPTTEIPSGTAPSAGGVASAGSGDPAAPAGWSDPAGQADPDAAAALESAGPTGPAESGQPAAEFGTDPEGTTLIPRIPDEPAWTGFDADAFAAAPVSAGEPEAAQPEPAQPDLGREVVAAPTRAQRRAATAQVRRDPVRTIARGIGQTLITLGVVLLLFVVYEVYITDIFSARKQDAATAKLDQSWETGSSSSAPSGAGGTTQLTDVVTVTDPNKLITDPRTRQRTYETFPGDGFAKLYIPAFGADYHYTIIEGISQVDLETGPGHYEDSQYPGEQGNFAIAGHRVSKGSPFNAMAQLAACDAIIVETRDDWFVYRMLPTEQDEANWSSTPHSHCEGVEPLTGEYAGVRGREITDPSDYAQVLPVPHVANATVPTDALRLITLTTCHPQFSDAQRMIIHGVLVKSYAKSDGFLPPELKET